jgi:hypothetical protein
MIRRIKSRRVRWAGHERRNAHRILMGKPEGKRLLGRLTVGGRITFKWILER